ncbi:MAG: type IV pili methyl-accepting chemotaxis transducer N-terminal domain-containing protein [Candidatus Sedimenticola sp. (ex Thyasira tokunagai)]
MLRHSFLTSVCGFFLLGLLSAAADAATMTYGEAINKAGRQRMLSQRIVKSYCQMGQDIRFLVAKKQRKGAIALFDKQLAELKAFNKDGETRRALQLTEKLWLPVKRAAMGKPTKISAKKLRANAEKLLVSAHQVVLLLEDQAGTNQGRLVNIAGRQRMLSQRMGNLYMLQSWGYEDEIYKADYDKAVGEFEDALGELKGANENTPEISRALKEAGQFWDMFKLSSRMDPGQFVPGLVARMLDKLLVKMNDITGMYAALPAAK